MTNKEYNEIIEKLLKKLSIIVNDLELTDADIVKIFSVMASAAMNEASVESVKTQFGTLHLMPEQ